MPQSNQKIVCESNHFCTKGVCNITFCMSEDIKRKTICWLFTQLCCWSSQARGDTFLCHRFPSNTQWRKVKIKHTVEKNRNQTHRGEKQKSNTWCRKVKIKHMVEKNKNQIHGGARKVEQMQPLSLCICLKKCSEETYDET